MGDRSDHNQTFSGFRVGGCKCCLGMVAAIALTASISFAQVVVIDRQTIRVDAHPQRIVEGSPRLKLDPDPVAIEEMAVSEELIAAVRDLDDVSYATRQQATEWLKSAHWDRAEVYHVLHKARLSPEQRQRLLAALYDQLVNTPRGAVGISQRWIEEPEEGFGMLEIEQLLPDLPARRFFQLRDRITHFDGMRPTHRTALGDYVQQKRPGELVTFTVQRLVRDEQGNALRDDDGEFKYKTITIELPLGSADKLIDPLTGRPQASSVQTQRRRQAAEAVTAFSEPAAIVRFRQQVDAQTSSQRLAELADQHREIHTLKRQLELVERGRLRYEDQLAGWDRKLQQLRLMRRDPSATELERALLDAIIDRFLELTQIEHRPQSGG